MKLTIVLDRLAFLFLDVRFDHGVGDGARRNREVPSGPEVLAPELLPEVGELLKEYPGADALEPLGDGAHVLVGPVAHEEVDVVACDLPRDDAELMFHGNLSEEVAHTNGHRADEDGLTVLRHPDEVDLEIVLRVRAEAILAHATTLPHPSLRLKARGFHHPRGGH